MINDSKDYIPVSRLLLRTAEFRRRTGRYVLIAFAIAAFLHIAGIATLLYYNVFGERYIAVTPVELKPYASVPLPEETPLEMSKPPELLDVPEEARVERPPDDPDPDIADKNSIARDRAEKNMAPERPFSEGEIALKETPDDEKDQHQDMAGGSRRLSPRSGGVEDFREVKELPKWTKELILRPDERGKKGKGRKGDGAGEGLASDGRLTGPKEKVYIPKDDLNHLAQQEKDEPAYKPHRKFGVGIGNPGSRVPQFKNKKSVARDFGDFAFSTTAWDYAPYLYELRERVRRRWFPPAAFELGMVSGRVIVNFKIMRNGQMKDFQILSYRDKDVAYQSLVDASANAVIAASPFAPLPKDFPDEYLEITGTFYYQILGYEN
jgi:hypothetical protein